MATRLTKEVRERILNYIINKTFEKRIKALRDARTKLGMEIYNHAVPADFLKMVKKRPADWFVRHSSIDVYLKAEGGGISSARFYLDRRTDRIELAGPMPFPASFGAYNTPDITIADKALISKVTEQMELERELADERTQLKNKLHGLLYSVNTLEALRKAAPELCDYFPEPAAKSCLPAVQVGEIVDGLKAAGLKIPAGK